MDMIVNDEEEKVSKLKSEILQLSYKDRNSVYNAFFDLGTVTSQDMDARLILFNLICLVTYKMRAKNPETTCLTVLQKIVGAQNLNKNDRFTSYIEGLAILCENLMYGCTKFNQCGLKTSDEIIKKIKELLDEWLPF